MPLGSAGWMLKLLLPAHLLEDLHEDEVELVDKC
jgi:hypothetical protein